MCIGDGTIVGEEASHAHLAVRSVDAGHAGDRPLGLALRQLQILQVASYELHLTSCELKVTGYR